MATRLDGGAFATLDLGSRHPTARPAQISDSAATRPSLMASTNTW